MPQLNPAPWLAILVITWFAFLTFIPYKVMNHTFPHEPNSIFLDNPLMEPWNWPWF